MTVTDIKCSGHINSAREIIFIDNDEVKYLKRTNNY